MSDASSGWFEQLEARLEQQLEAFLRANPAQEALLRDQELQERQRRLQQRRLDLQQQAEHTRAELLQLAADIARWQQRVERARGAGALDLAGRAEAHVHRMMGQGRDRWQALGELGAQFRQVDQDLEQLARQTPRPAAQPVGGPGFRPAGPTTSASSPEADLDQAWAAFETDQELEQLRRGQRPS